jgi:hypothetical protein
MIKHIIPFTFLGFALGCRGEGPTATQDLTPNFGIAGSSGCYTVSGSLDQAGGPVALSGTISGDVEGTVITVGGPVVGRGDVVFRPVEQTWAITGGIVEPLIGQTLHLENDFVGINAQPPLLRVNTTARVVEGARIGNLTYHGTTDVSAFPSVTSHLEYDGVICL